MKLLKQLLVILALLMGVNLHAQYNPTNPAEPGAYYTLTLKCTPANAGSFNINSVTSYASGSTVSLRAYANTYFKFIGWEEDGKTISTSSSFSYKIGTRNTTLTARFEYDPGNPAEPAQPNLPVYSNLYLSATPSDGGTFSISSGNRYEVGSSVSVRAYANSNFSFKNWTEDGKVISTSASFNYVMKAGNPRLVANFEYTPGNPAEPEAGQFKRKLYLKCNPSEGGYFNVTSGNEYTEGSSVSLRAYSNQYYTFKNWTIDGEVISESYSFSYLIPSRDVTLVANYIYNYDPTNPTEPNKPVDESINIYGLTETIARGTTINYPIYFENSVAATGMVVDLQLPECFKADPGKIILSGRCTDHSISVVDLGDNAYRISLLGENAFSNDNGKIFEIPVTATENAQIGETYEVKLSHGVAHLVDGRVNPTPVRSGNLCVTGELPTPVTGITLSQSNARLRVGATLQLSANVIPATATVRDVKWTTSDPKVATVDSNGKVTAVALGTARITAAATDKSGVSADCEITVEATPVESITLSAQSISFKVGETALISATVKPDDATDKSLKWTVADPSVATVTDGKVTAIAVGTTTLTATATDGSGVSAVCAINVIPTPAESITLSQTTASLRVGESIIITATVFPESTTNKGVTWTSSNTNIVSVDAKGTITAIGLGEAVVTAKCGDATASCTIKVNPTTAESITLSQATAQLKVGESVILKATVLPETTTDKNVTWTSSNEAVAVVDRNGKVTAVALGSSTITVRCGEASANCSVEVVATPVESISINQTTASIKVGESFALTAVVLPENATNKTVLWLSSNESVASVNAQGQVTAVSVGEAVITASCGSVSASCTVTVIPTPVEKITLSQTTASLKVGEYVTLSATVIPADATDKTITWSTSNATVATVDNNGRVTAVMPGDAVVTAKCGNVSATCSITVLPIPAESIALNQSAASLKVGASITLKATVLPADATDKTVTWSSSNTAVASVDNEGKVTAIALGDAVITAKCGNVSATCSVKVIPTEVEEITLSQSAASLKVGGTVTLTATVIPPDATDKTITWTSSNAAVATVDANGKVTAIALGDAVITAKCGKVSATCSIKVIPTPVEGITLSRSAASLKVGETVTLTATVIPADATDKTITWTSSNAAVATVDMNGKVTAIKLGEAVITAKCGDFLATCSVKVIPTPVDGITLSRSTASLKVGETVTLTATIIPADATDKTITWTSSNATVATVDANGKVTAVTIGDAVITAKCGEISATCSVKVIPTPVVDITLNLTTASLKVGESVTIEATVIPADATDKTISWSSSNIDVATVDTNGKVTAVGIGDAVITAESGGISAVCSIKVIPTPVESITLSQNEASLKVGETMELAATVLPSNATDKTVTWSTSDAAVATVDANGTVTAVGGGEAVITAKSGSVSATCEIIVLPIPVESIILTYEVWSGVEGECIQLVGKVLPENATDKSLNWKSSDESVATVDNTGLVTVQMKGTCVITASANDGSGIEATCIVTGISGIEQILADSDAEVDVYNLNGILLKKACDKAELRQLLPGTYILRQGSRAVKVIVN